MNRSATSSGSKPENAFVARTPKELVHLDKYVRHAPNRKSYEELLQMEWLIKFLTPISLIEFPFSVCHTGNVATPDFQLIFGSRRVAAELTKLTSQDLENGRALQRRDVHLPLGTGFNKTLISSNLEVTGEEPRNRGQISAEGFCGGQFAFPESPGDRGRAWGTAVHERLIQKTQILESKHFVKGDEQWLVLWERLGFHDDEVDQRIEHLKSLLEPFWSSSWFSRVFLQAEHFGWLAMFTEQEARVFDIK